MSCHSKMHVHALSLIEFSWSLVWQAISPHYIFTYFIRTGLTGWESLGGIVLAITDERLYHDTASACLSPS